MPWTSGGERVLALEDQRCRVRQRGDDQPDEGRAARGSGRRPATSRWRPNGIASPIMIRRLHEQDHDVAERAPEKHRRPAHRRDPHPLDDAVAELGDQAEADERRPEQRHLDQQPGHEPVVGVDARRRPR